MVRTILSTLLELVGIAVIVCGFYLIAPFLGLIVGGLGLILLGMATDPPKREVRQQE